MYSKLTGLRFWLTAVVTGGAVALQAQEGVPVENWHLLDYSKNGVYGIGINRAYHELLKNRTSKAVVVAVIDSGIDTLHEDLKPVLWHNPQKEGEQSRKRAGRYWGDEYGWNFIGNRDSAGYNLLHDSQEEERFYYLYRSRFETLAAGKRPAGKDRRIYTAWLRSKKALVGRTREQMAVDALEGYLYNYYPRWDALFQKLLARKVYTGKEVQAYQTEDKLLKMDRYFYGLLFAKVAPAVTNAQLPQALMPVLDSMRRKIKIPDTPPADYRAAVVKDNYNKLSDRYYGNSNVMAANRMHGTHAAGIIGAVRENGKGMDGVADKVQIMMVRVVPEGDEHDKDVALAIRYAVDNGAQIINMSFGKAYSPQQHWVEAAIRYAGRRGVLIVKAAGNSGASLDSVPDYPAGRYLNNNTPIPYMITVGASGPGAEALIPGFTNYGRESVDVFAPGVQIYSTVGYDSAGRAIQGYKRISGTSMAAPVVTGMAAVLKSYYPRLSAADIKAIIEASVTPVAFPVQKPQSGQWVPMAALCKTGGIVNAFEAVLLAEQYLKNGYKQR